jgi:hypothetical protein
LEKAIGVKAEEYGEFDAEAMTIAAAAAENFIFFNFECRFR